MKAICTRSSSGGHELTSEGGINSCEVSAQHAGQVPPEHGVAAVRALASGGCCSGRRRSVVHRPHSPLDALDGLRKLLQLDHYLHQSAGASHSSRFRSHCCGR